MNSLLKFKRFSEQLNICARYRREWDKSTNLQDIMDMALSAQGVEFTCDACAFKWGLSRDYILNNVGDYINGRYQRNKDGYTSEMYVADKGEKTLRSTLNLLIGCNGTVIVPKFHICKIYVCESDISLHSIGKCELYIYGDNCKVDIPEESSANVTINRVSKSNWIKDKTQGIFSV